MTQLILSLFPGADLFGRAFEKHGACVVRGPEILLGQDFDSWPLPPAGRFDGLIAGPPCQSHSLLRNIGGAEAIHKDYVPDCFRLAHAMGVKFAVIENVPNVLSTHPVPEGWGCLSLSDWECGGNTIRQRVFYIWPRVLILAVPVPPRRNGAGEASVLASSNKPKSAKGRKSRHGSLTPARAGELQGWSEIAETLLEQADVGAKGHRLIGARLIVHYLGNGVPRAMGEWIARHILNQLEGGKLCREAGHASCDWGSRNYRDELATCIRCGYMPWLSRQSAREVAMREIMENSQARIAPENK